MPAGSRCLDIEVAKRLHDAHQACIKLVELTKHVDFPLYSDNETLRLACERLLGIVGEALTVALRTDSSLDTALPDIRRAIGLRNRIIHAYHDVSDALIWDTIGTNIPQLAGQLERLLEHGPIV